MAALDDVLPLLRCPTCGETLAREGGTVRCAAGHSFDVARQGYLSLLAGGRTAAEGDSPDMVAAREHFLDAGHFQPLATALGDMLDARLEGTGSIVDLGAGTGWYLARVLDRFPAAAGLALDVSKPALRRAAARIRGPPPSAATPGARSRCATASPRQFSNVFAPRNPAEIARVLSPDGAAADRDAGGPSISRSWSARWA